ncbi:MAG TPA: adenylate/guanylate cyclase domain-containing protein, partial [Acidimicrobiia bacterium]
MRTSVDSERLPTGTVTFLFTDIEGSTDVVRRIGDVRFASWINTHLSLIADAIKDHDGVEVASEGDSVFAAFADAKAALDAAIQIQRAMATEVDAEVGSVKVRVGIHTGNGVLGGDNYVGIDVHRAARIGDSGHGGQILLSEATARLTEYSLPEGTRLQDLGTHRLRDLTHEEHIYQLDIDGIPNQFAPLRTLSATKGNLPLRDLTLVGRQREKEAVIAALDESRLVTLTGPGGVGKTTLALKVAEELSPDYEDGVWFIEVSRVPEETLLPAAIARQLHITESPLTSVTDTLVSRLAAA